MRPLAGPGWIPARLAGHALAYFASGRWLRTSPRLDGPAEVPADFFGLCAANGPDPATDAYVLERLDELGVRHVRLDFTYTDRDSYTERFLNRLLADRYGVCLHLVQPREEARAMGRDPRAAERWRAFVADMLDRYGRRAALIEVGTVCNRRKWSGYSPASFYRAWQIAWTEARGRGITLAGPNVTDFEPVYNAGWLGLLRRDGMAPSIHTDNVFVERATEPEAYDPKIFGRRLAGLARGNLVRKARLLRDIGVWADAPDLLCTHVSWSLRRIARFLEDVEDKQADYLSRYVFLAAASGALRRLYWGPLIGQREGLVDDGTTEYPDPPHVAYYEQARGSVSDYRLRPAFGAFRTAVRLLAGATFRRTLPAGPSVTRLEFSGRFALQPGAEPLPGVLHAVWTRDGCGAETMACYPDSLLSRARVLSRDGGPLSRPPRFLGESPVFLFWPDKSAPDSAAVTIPPSAADNRLAAGLRFARQPGWDYDWLRPANARVPAGLYLSEAEGIRHNAGALLALAEHCPGAGPGGGAILRRARNTVWTAPAPWAPDQVLVVKRFAKRRLFRRLLDGGKPDKARRSWNGAQELIRRGLNTPRPLACIWGGVAPVYVCEALLPSGSARDVFNAFRSGAGEFQGLPAADWYRSIAAFLQKLHTRGVFFRDLSAGNLLVRRMADGRVEFALIDTARARFYRRRLGLWARLGDLMRLCHPLHEAGRRELLELYLAHSGRRFRHWMRIPFRYYDAKHRIKNRLKPLRGRS